jgi:hypothetical protein
MDVVQVLAAGVGSMALLRSSLATVSTAEGDVQIGFATLVDMAREVADRGVERGQGRRRSRAAKRYMAGVSFDKAKEALPTYALSLLREGPREEDATFLAEQIATLEALDLDDRAKAQALGPHLIRVFGTSVFKQATTDLWEQIALPDAKRPSTWHR